MPISITDPGDSRIAAYRHLRDSELRRRMEADQGLFVVEGPGALRILLTTDWPVLSLLLRPERAAALDDVVDAAQARGAPVYVASPACFDAIAGFRVHRGVLALGGRRPEPDPSTLLARADIVVVLEGVNDHENLGAIFRNAAALGAGAVLLDPTCCDPLYRRSVRVSVGQVLRVPFSRMSPWPKALDTVTSSGFSIVAMDPHSPTTIDAIPSLAKMALMVGREGPGLSQGAYSKATWRVRIPMAPGVDSLNVASALAIALNRLVPL